MNYLTCEKTNFYKRLEEPSAWRNQSSGKIGSGMNVPLKKKPRKRPNRKLRGRNILATIFDDLWTK